MATRRDSRYQDAQTGETSTVIALSLSLSNTIPRPARGGGDVSRQRHASPGAIKRTPGFTGWLPCVSI